MIVSDESVDCALYRALAHTGNTWLPTHLAPPSGSHLRLPIICIDIWRVDVVVAEAVGDHRGCDECVVLISCSGAST